MLFLLLLLVLRLLHFILTLFLLLAAPCATQAANNATYISANIFFSRSFVSCLILLCSLPLFLLLLLLFRMKNHVKVFITSIADIEHVKSFFVTLLTSCLLQSDKDFYKISDSILMICYDILSQIHIMLNQQCK
jgi:hypothetical protein